MLEAQRICLLEQGMLSEEDVHESAIEHLPDGVRIGTRSAPWLIRCAGPFATLSGMIPVKGEGLTVALPSLPRHCMVHKGVFALPVPEGLHRVGATFAWERVWDGPTDEAREWLLGKLDKLTPAAPQVVDHWAGVRPTSADRRPIMGATAAHEAVLNGLGARGVLLAPWCAAHLADHLFNNKALDPEVDVVRFAQPS
jgi:glycine/D-amino acid oxidase-like deaminating enzyme